MFSLSAGVTFKKTGAEIKAVAARRMADLEGRLAKRNAALDEVMNDRKRLRSFLVRDPNARLPGVLSQFQHDVPSEDHEEIAELCRRVFVLEKELSRLRMVLAHLGDGQEFDLTFEQMQDYGFAEASGA
jgi:hypothetical protein